MFYKIIYGINFSQRILSFLFYDQLCIDFIEFCFNYGFDIKINCIFPHSELFTHYTHMTVGKSFLLLIIVAKKNCVFIKNAFFQ